MNNNAVPAVNSLTTGDLEWMLTHADYFRVDELDNSLAAFLVGFSEGSSYPSVNYQWFASRYAAFAYIDRIVVDPGKRRSGSASRLYADFFKRLARRSGLATCEVNLKPENPASMAFHTALGFERTGTQDSADGAKTVAMLECRL